MPVIPTLGRLRLDREFKASLGYTARACLKKKKKKKSWMLVAHTYNISNLGG
jgi:hypothetical protein